MSILIAHPTRQHSHRLAQALHDAGWLHSYWTLLPERRTLSWLPACFDGLLPSSVMRHSLEFLPAEKVHTLIGPLLIQKLASHFKSPAIHQSCEWMAWSIFDRWVARQLPRLRPKVVVGYEVCCAETFRMAKSLGITRVLDAAAFHYLSQVKALDEDKLASKSWAGNRMRCWKLIEIELADKIICVSEMARRSYLDAGVRADRIVVNQVGCNVGMFAASTSTARTGHPKFVFVGTPAYHKGTDLLAFSFSKVLDHYPHAELHMVGDPGLAQKFMTNVRVQIHGKLSHDQLSQLLAMMDCLILPSRLESFGMVVVEALAAGVPVIVSDRVGASEAIVENENGWVVQAGNAQSLHERMLACCHNIENIRKMHVACSRSAFAYDWSQYAKRAKNIFEPLLTA